MAQRDSAQATKFRIHSSLLSLSFCMGPLTTLGFLFFGTRAISSFPSDRTYELVIECAHDGLYEISSTDVLLIYLMLEV